MTNRHTLANGLRIIHHEDTTTQMVAVNLLYNVGARNEDPEHTGYAHLIEHLMFEGSVNIPDYDTHVQLAGGENNAWTNNDLTNYYITLPKSNVETAFWLESDRMLGLALTEQSVEVQKGVVIEEFKQRHLNRPYGENTSAAFSCGYPLPPVPPSGFLSGMISHRIGSSFIPSPAQGCRPLRCPSGHGAAATCTCGWRVRERRRYTVYPGSGRREVMLCE